MNDPRIQLPPMPAWLGPVSAGALIMLSIAFAILLSVIEPYGWVGAMMVVGALIGFFVHWARTNDIFS